MSDDFPRFSLGALVIIGKYRFNLKTLVNIEATRRDGKESGAH